MEMGKSRNLKHIKSLVLFGSRIETVNKFGLCRENIKSY